MDDERDPEDILRKMEELLEAVRNGTVERAEVEPDETDPIVAHHREVIERGANADSADEG